MNCEFKESDQDEIRMTFENGEIAKVILYYKDDNGLKTGIEELKKRELEIKLK